MVKEILPLLALGAGTAATLAKVVYEASKPQPPNPPEECITIPEGDGIITGTITDAEFKTPIEGVRISIYSLDTQQTLEEIYTNSDGVYTTSMIPYGYYLLNCYKEGYVYAAIPCTLDSITKIWDFELILLTTLFGSIRGRVLDQMRTGMGAHGITTTVWPSEPIFGAKLGVSAMSHSAITDENGYYWIPQAMVGTYDRVTVDGAGIYENKEEEIIFNVEENQTTNVPDIFVMPIGEPPPEAIVRIESIPYGANIYLNGIPYRITNNTITVETGTYILKLTMDGYYDVDDTLILVAGNNGTKSYTLIPIEPLLAVVAVWSVPFDASVYIDGEYVGTTIEQDWLFHQVEAGTHTVRVSKDGYNDYFEEFVATTEATSYFDVRLVSTTEISRVEITPSSAILNLGDQQTFTATAYDNQDNDITTETQFYWWGGDLEPVFGNSTTFTGIEKGIIPIYVDATYKDKTITAEATVNVVSVETGIAGRVIDSITGAGIPNVTIGWGYQEGSVERFKYGITDSNGYYEITGGVAFHVGIYDRVNIGHVEGYGSYYLLEYSVNVLEGQIAQAPDIPLTPLDLPPSPPPLKYISITPTGVSPMDIGEQQLFYVTLRDADWNDITEYGTINWWLTGDNIGTIDSNQGGSTIFTATSSGNGVLHVHIVYDWYDSVRDIPIEVLEMPPPPKATIRLQSNPTDAEIYLNEVYYGNTEMTIETEPGTYVITIKKEGYYSASMPHVLNEGWNGTWNPTLTPIEVAPEIASVTIRIIGPATIPMHIGEQLQLLAIAYDVDGNDITADTDFLWYVTGGIGDISPTTGTFTEFTATTAGTGTIYIDATHGGKTVTNHITIPVVALIQSFRLDISLLDGPDVLV